MELKINFLSPQSLLVDLIYMYSLHIILTNLFNKPFNIILPFMLVSPKGLRFRLSEL
jgi:hypothetical protein